MSMTTWWVVLVTLLIVVLCGASAFLDAKLFFRIQEIRENLNTSGQELVSVSGPATTYKPTNRGESSSPLARNTQQGSWDIDDIDGCFHVEPVLAGGGQ